MEHRPRRPKIARRKMPTTRWSVAKSVKHKILGKIRAAPRQAQAQGERVSRYATFIPDLTYGRACYSALA
jgi:hypothetical protein